MKQRISHETHPCYIYEIARDECRFKTLREVVDYYRECIESHEFATFIAEFDHFAHTRSIAKGQVDEAIRGAVNVVFCFGITLPDPEQMALRPKSMGIVDLDDRFLITFLEAPMPVANKAMENWTRALAAS